MRAVHFSCKAQLSILWSWSSITFALKNSLSLCICSTWISPQTLTVFHLVFSLLWLGFGIWMFRLIWMGQVNNIVSVSHTWQVFFHKPACCSLLFDETESKAFAAGFLDRTQHCGVSNRICSVSSAAWLHSSGTGAWLVFWRAGVTCSGLHAGWHHAVLHMLPAVCGEVGSFD